MGLEVERLIEPSTELGCIVPAYGGRSVANVAPSLVRALEVELRGEPTLLPPLSPDLNPFASSPLPGPVIVFAVDGLGWFPFVRWAGSAAEGPSSWLPYSRPITSVFPTTTSTALVSLSSGVSPSTHGIVGYRQYLPRYGVVADLLKFMPLVGGSPGSLAGPDWRPEMVCGAGSILSRGVAGAVVTRREFQGTPFTRMLYEGAEFVPYSTASDLAHGLSHVLRRANPPPVVFVYWDELDTVQHLRGPQAEITALELDRLRGLLGYVAASLPGPARRATTVLLTSDHGQVPATVEARVRVEALPAVVHEMSRPLAGDRRAGLFAARPGRVDALHEALTRALPERAKVIDIPRAVRAGLFGPGPFHPELTERLGDFLVLLPSPGGLTYLPPGASAPDRFLAGAHGGLEPEELVVPLVAGTLEQLTETPVARPKE